MAIKLTPKAIREQLAELRGQGRSLHFDFLDGQELLRIETEALRKRCPHANTQRMKGYVGPEDESTVCLDCGASGTTPTNLV